jgi:hypothetical protein
VCCYGDFYAHLVALIKKKTKKNKKKFNVLLMFEIFYFSSAQISGADNLPSNVSKTQDLKPKMPYFSRYFGMGPPFWRGTPFQNFRLFLNEF